MLFMAKRVFFFEIGPRRAQGARYPAAAQRAASTSRGPGAGNQPACGQPDIEAGCARDFPIRLRCATAAACSRPRAQSRWRRRLGALLATAEQPAQRAGALRPEDLGSPVQPAAHRTLGMVRFPPPLIGGGADGAGAKGANPRGAARPRHFEIASSRPARPIWRSVHFPAAAGYLRRQRLFSDALQASVARLQGHPRACRGGVRASASSPSATS